MSKNMSRNEIREYIQSLNDREFLVLIEEARKRQLLSIGDKRSTFFYIYIMDNLLYLLGRKPVNWALKNVKDLEETIIPYISPFDEGTIEFILTEFLRTTDEKQHFYEYSYKFKRWLERNLPAYQALIKLNRIKHGDMPKI